MLKLLRRSSHGNQVSVLEDTKRNLIVKDSSNLFGRSLIHVERNGIIWYSSAIQQPNLIESFFEDDTRTSIYIRKFNGKQAIYTRSIVKNYDYLLACVEHYIACWPREENTLIHGDLTLDNVIFTHHGPRFFDWEHFTDTERHPWGFDAMYLLLSALMLPLKKDQVPTKAELNIFIDLIFILLKEGLSPSLAEYPLNFFRGTLSCNIHWKNIVRYSPNKLFPLKYDELYSDVVDDLIARRIRHRRYEDYKKAVLKADR